MKRNAVSARRLSSPPKGRVKVNCLECSKPVLIPARDFWAEAAYAEAFKEKPKGWFCEPDPSCFRRYRDRQHGKKGGSRPGAGRPRKVPA